MACCIPVHVCQSPQALHGLDPNWQWQALSAVCPYNTVKPLQIRPESGV